LDLQHISSHAYDFEIPLKGFKSPLVDLATTRFHQHLVLVLVNTVELEDTEPLRSHM